MAFMISQKGIDFIKSFEGCVLTAYEDSAKVWTIGYGHTSGVMPGMKITAAQAEIYLKFDVAVFERAVNKYVTATISQNMFDALVSFSFNLGTGALKNSTLLRKLNNGDIKGAADEFDKWIYAGGVMLSGLVRRRKAEKELFLSEGSIDRDCDGLKRSSDYVIQKFQKWLNEKYGSQLIVDGYYGRLTKEAAIKSYQKILGVKADGVFGEKSRNAVVSFGLGEKGNTVYLMQGMLYCQGIHLNGVDGIWGMGTTRAVKDFQLSNGLVADGVAGKATMYALYNERGYCN
ncbi:glycoside hydrolase family protein [Lachnospiraceae bacterium OttesenSCG-928-D06]|nr:glycoside hydrolase family protein [Lachnospiraceae bacterium OttesenSCG-928-D06]